MFQIQHANDQFQLDLKKIGLDFSQIQRKLLDQERGVLLTLGDSENRDEQVDLDEIVRSLDQVSEGFSSLGKRLNTNE